MAKSLFAQPLENQLKKGPLILIETDKKGEFSKATGIVLIHAPIESVWNVIIDYEKYFNFMPKLAASKIEKKEGNTAWVHFEIDLPGPNPEYTMKIVLDHENYRVRETWHRGDYEGTYYYWRLYPKGKDTIGYFGGSTKNFSGLLQKLDDKQQTVTIGVNVGTVLAVVKAIKNQTEKIENKKRKEKKSKH